MARQTEQVELAAEKRTVLGKQVKQLRQQGQVPGVVYGHDFDSLSLQFDKRELKQVLSQVGGSQLINLKIEGFEEPEMALVREVQRDSIRGTFLHVDFYRVDMAERITAEIPIEKVGESTAEEGILLYGLSSIEVECLPGDLVDAIEVDLSVLTEIDQALYVRDLAIPAGIDVITEPNEMIANVVRMKTEEELEELLEVEEEEVMMPAAPEVEVITEAGLEEEEMVGEEAEEPAEEEMEEE